MHQLRFAAPLLLALCLAPLHPAGAAQKAAAPCAAPEYRQLDFWIGQWRVLNTADKAEYGSSDIAGEMQGCAISESYRAPAAPGSPYEGASHSGYDRKDGHWHQMYVDSNGNVTWFTGGPQGPQAMVFEGEGKAGARQRMTYRQQADGSVRQTGETSTDGGANWQPAYDYTYVKRQAAGSR